MSNLLKDWKNLRQYPAAVLGAGVSGKGVCELLKHLNWEYRVYDEQGHVFDKSEACSCSIIISSPGFNANHPWKLLAKKYGKNLISEIDFSSYFLKSKIIGITGTNGKTSVTSFLTHLWESIGHNAISAGNIGFPLSRTVLREKQNNTVFLEISSFQAEDMVSTKLDSLLWTNLDTDHIDQHGSMENYFRAKAKLIDLTKSNNIFVSQSVVDYAKKINYELPKKLEIFNVDSELVRLSKHSNFFTTQPQILNLSLIKSFLNNQNVGRESLIRALKSYVPEPHRLQKVEIVNDITFWDDSKATNFASAIAACENFKGNVYWIGGGRYKGGCIEELAKKIKPVIKKAFLIGESGRVLAGIFKKIGQPYILCKSLEDAVKKAFVEASSITNILLSPGFSSFDLFKNYQERGKLFKKFVLEIKKLHSFQNNHIIA